MGTQVRPPLLSLRPWAWVDPKPPKERLLVILEIAAVAAELSASTPKAASASRE